jgi:two-component system sensor histidine kinase AtoS
VLVNVLANAQQAVLARADASHPPIHLRTIGGPSGGWCIEVTDRGVGIAPSDLPRLFEPFFTTRPAGSGIGLALARNIVEGLGGAIVIESAVGAGTTVRIDLPERTIPQEVSA